MPSRLSTPLFCFLLPFSIAHSQNSETLTLPLNLPAEQIKPLRECGDKEFQKALEATLKKNKSWARLVDRKRMAVGVVDLSDSHNIKYAQANGNLMMYAASLPKIAILLAAFQELEDGRLNDTPQLQQDLRAMISRSDNEAATRMIDQVGGFRMIEHVLRDPRYDLYDPNWGGGLWVGKRYSKDGKRYPDPVLGTSHGATVSQVCRFYYLLAMGRLINPERSRQMLTILEDPELHHKFMYTLDHIAPEARIYRKSGTWKKWHSDSVLVWGPVWRRYILAALIEDKDGETILRNLLQEVDTLLKSQSSRRKIQ